MPLNPDFGVEAPPRVAVIDETRCIGCAKCLPPCPVDAIIGAPRFMHTVAAQLCNGCELCIAPCPVDCITMVAVTAAVIAAIASTAAVIASVVGILINRNDKANEWRRDQIIPPVKQFLTAVTEAD